MIKEAQLDILSTSGISIGGVRKENFRLSCRCFSTSHDKAGSMDSSSGTPGLSSIDRKLITDFLSSYFENVALDHDIGLNEKEQQLIKTILTYVDSHFKRRKYVLGLAIDFAALAQELSKVDSAGKNNRLDLTGEKLFRRYELVEERAGTKQNTLTLRYGSTVEGIRKPEEEVEDLFHALKRPSFPSSYVYSTGQWHKYKDLLVYCFQLSERGRLELCKKLIEYGLDHMEVADFYGRATPRPTLFAEIIREYPRSAKGENGGLTYQALAYGFLKADRPHLSIVTDKVRRGSKRQKQIGDIDCYAGLDLELSSEVKDFVITIRNLIHELGEFIQSIEDTKAPGLVFVEAIEDDALEQLQDHGIHAITVTQILGIASIWDWHKQNAAALGMLHFLAHIEQNPTAVERLLTFIQSKDPEHDSLIYFKGTKDG